MSERLCSAGGGIAALERDICEFSKTSKLPVGLGRHVPDVPAIIQADWYKEMSNAWRDSKTPKLETLEDGTKLVFDMMCKLYPHFSVTDIEGILDFYGLPSFYDIPDELEPRASLNSPDELKPRAEDAPLKTTYDDQLKPPDKVQKPVVKDFAEFLLETLPVTRDQVTDGVSVTVFVEVRKSYVLSSKMLLLLNERRKALAKKDARRASQLLNEINTTEDYKMQTIHDVEILTKKYEIRLKGIYVPETSDGIEARDELARMVDGKCLFIEVYYLDDKKRCVGDVYCDDIHLQGSLLDKESAWEREKDDAQLKKWMEQAEKLFSAMKWKDIPPDSGEWHVWEYSTWD